VPKVLYYNCPKERGQSQEPRERLKNISEKAEKPLDKPKILWYNVNTIRVATNARKG